MPAIPLESPILGSQDRMIGYPPMNSFIYDRYSPILSRSIKGKSTPPLLSSSIRARASPRFIHGNSPLLQSWEVSPPAPPPTSNEEQLSSSSREERSASPGQFDDADGEAVDIPSPSSIDLGEHLRSALQALEELQDAVRKQQRKRGSINLSSANANPAFTGLATVPPGGLAAMIKRTEAGTACMHGSDGDVVICPLQDASVGLGLSMPSEPLPRASWSENEIELPMSKSVETSSIQKRNWSQGESIACASSTTAFKAIPSSARTVSSAHTNFPTVFVTKQESTPMFTTAPSTPVLEATTTTDTAAAIASTPALPLTTLMPFPLAQSFGPGQPSSGNHQSQTHNGGTTTQSQTSTHPPTSSLVAVASVSAAGSLLLLAAVLLVLLKQRRRNNEHREKMDAILNKVAIHSTSSPDHEDDNDKSGSAKKIEEKGEEADKSKRETAASPAMVLPPIPASPPNELRMVTPWLNYDMPSHPFANAAVRGSERFSPDLAQSGVIRHEVSRDQSFHWNFPKLSVPPAAARALATGHYVKKRSTMPRKSMPSPRQLGREGDEEEEETVLAAPPRSLSYCSDTSARLPAGEDLNLSVRNLSASASSDVVDPQLDCRRKSFTVGTAAATSSCDNDEVSPESKSWLKNALRQLVQPTQNAGVGKGEEDGQRCMSLASSTPWVPNLESRISFTGRSRRQGKRMEEADSPLDDDRFSHYGLPSLSIANSSIVDANTRRIMSGEQQQQVTENSSSISSTNRRSFNFSRTPSRGMSSASEDSHQPARRESYACVSRRVSGSASFGEKGRQQQRQQQQRNSDGTQTATESYQLRRSTEYASHSQWMPDATDTEDESREGYDAEQENDTEVDHDMELDQGQDYDQDLQVHFHAPVLSRQQLCSVNEDSSSTSASSSTFSTPVITLTCSEEEGRFERRISVTSRQARGNLDGEEERASSEEQDPDRLTEHATNVKTDDEDEDNVTTVIHSLDGSGFASGSKSGGSSGSNATDDDDDYDLDLDPPDVFDCLVSDEFPTIPEWTPIQAA